MRTTNLQRLHKVLGERRLDLRLTRSPPDYDVEDRIRKQPRLIGIGHRDANTGECRLQAWVSRDGATYRVGQREARDTLRISRDTLIEQTAFGADRPELNRRVQPDGVADSAGRIDIGSRGGLAAEWHGNRSS